MGHAVLALQSRRSSWVSRWHALFSTTKNGDAPSTPQSLQKSRSAKSFNASSLLAFARKPIGCISKCWPRKSAPLSQFESLPPELILKIEQYLSLNSALSLSYTCRAFRETMKIRVADLEYLVDMESILKDLKESQEERRVSFQRLAFLCMLERDGRLSASKAICSGCRTTHDVSLFSSTTLRQRSHQRLCMDREGRL